MTDDVYILKVGPDMLEREYQRFAKANVPAGASLGQQGDMQRSFYAGVLTMLHISEALAELGDDFTGLLILEQIRLEALSFAVSTVAICGAQRHD